MVEMEGGTFTIGSPSRLGRSYSDRFIPSRTGSDLNTYALELANENAGGTVTSVAQTDRELDTSQAYSAVLRSALLSDLSPSSSRASSFASPLSANENRGLERRASWASGAGASPSRNLFRFLSDTSGAGPPPESPFSVSPLGGDSPLDGPGSQRKLSRKIARSPFKVLDAPQLADDFYLNLVDWGNTNVLAVGLGYAVYLWNASTSKVTKLLDLTSSTDPIASVSWTQRGQYLAVGTAKGSVQLWDATACRMVRSLSGHRHRVCSLAWHGHNMCSGSRDRTILVRDVRTSANEAIVAKLTCHRSEVCGLRWSPDGRELASGGNDNMVCIWSARHMFGSTAAREAQDTPMLRFEAHTAAIKALAWSPHTSNLLATGGGTADRCIRFWSTATGGCLGCVDTGSQVCNLAWSANVDELVSTHGYSQNQVILWRHGGPTGVPGSPSGGTVATAAGTTTGGQNAGTGAAGGAMMPPGMQRLSKMATLVGHSMRVLYLAVSPDGQTIVTGAGDETLRFWNLFPGAPNCHFRQPVSPLCLGRSSIR